MSRDELDALLDAVVPGAGSGEVADSPDFPQELGLTPQGVIGRGGVGWVWKAHDPVLDRPVAVKIARSDGGEAARKALLAEAQLTARIRHPAVLPVHSIVVARGMMCVIFQLAPESTLEARLRDAKIHHVDWPLEDRVAFMLSVTSAVARAHALGVVHGDLHPGNLALGDQGEPYVLDWGGLTQVAGTFSGSPGYAAPEQLRGDAPDAASDVFALGALLYEVVSLQAVRPRLHNEDLGAFIARWRAGVAPELSGEDPVLTELVQGAMATEPAARPTAEELREGLSEVLTGHSIRSRRLREARSELESAREALARYHDVVTRISQEEQVKAVQNAKTLGHAPISQKQQLWATEDRVAALHEEQADAWLEAVDRSTRVSTLAPIRRANPGEDVGAAAKQLLAELWYERMRLAENSRSSFEAERFERMVRSYDQGHYTQLLERPSNITLSTNVEGATVRIYRFVEKQRVLTEDLVVEVPMPLERHALPPGTYVLVVSAPGYRDARYPIWLRRLQHHRGDVRLYTDDEIGEAWVYVPGGTFRLGGDPMARQPLDACEPFLPDRFFTRTMITAAEWLTFLEDLPVETAARHVPGEAGLFGTFQAYWTHDGDRWVLPEGYDPRWPIMSVSYEDAVVYAEWRSKREGRVVRLPNEEEWEKAARGADGRSYPWGDRFDPTFAHMRQSVPGAPRPAPVGTYPVDTSVYGLKDMAGGMRELTSTVFDEGQMVMRGGTWGDDPDDCRCANRSGIQPAFRYAFVSFRLITESPRT